MEIRNCNIINLVHRDVKRKYISPEWLSKISSAEFQGFVLWFKNTYYYGDKTESEFQEILDKEIADIEKQYQKLNENIVKSKELDKNIKENLDKISALVSAPSIPNAVLEARKKGILFEDSNTAHITKMSSVLNREMFSKKYNCETETGNEVRLGGTYPQDFLIKNGYNEKFRCGGSLSEDYYQAKPSGVEPKITGSTSNENSNRKDMCV